MIANVTGDTASASYDLLAGTPGGTYTIQAVYTDPVDFKTSTGFNQLTVNPAATTVAVSGSSATFSEISGEGTTLSANVSSSAGTSNEGSVTFTILNGSTQIAGPFVMSVANGVAGGIVFCSCWDGGRLVHHRGRVQRDGQLCRVAPEHQQSRRQRSRHHHRGRGGVDPVQRRRSIGPARAPSSPAWPVWLTTVAR